MKNFIKELPIMYFDLKYAIRVKHYRLISAGGNFKNRNDKRIFPQMPHSRESFILSTTK